MTFDKTAYLECLDQAEETIRAMYSTVEREVEWTLTDELTSKDAKSITDKITAGLNEALEALNAQRDIAEAYNG